jgi:thymidylate synthase (FAD)
VKHELVGKKFDVLDKGHVILLDFMGSDHEIAEAARVSYGGGTKSASDDRKLIRYLVRHSHTSPLEMAEIKLHIHLPIFVERQFVRHRTANLNEISGRYSILPEETYVPDKDRIAQQSTTNKQGSGEIIDPELAECFQNSLQDSYEKSFESYHWALNDGITRELARLALPLATYTTKIWKCDLHNTLHLLQLRLDEQAQDEIREYAKVIADIVKELFPITFEAFCDYRLEAVTFSRMELKYIDGMIKGYAEAVPDLSEREIDEFKAKIDKVYKAQRAKEQAWASAGSQN